MARNKIGFLASGSGGNPTGIGAYVDALDAAGIPAVVFCNDGDVGISNAIARITSGSQVPHVMAFRVVRDGNPYWSVPDYAKTPVAAAQEHWNKIRPYAHPTVTNHKDKIWWLPVNELDKNRADWIGRFLVELAALMNAAGYKCAGPAWAGGEPEPAHWETPGMVSYLQYCAANPAKAAVAAHEYWLTISPTPPLVDTWYMARYRHMFAVCDARGIARPKVLISEWGWTDTNIPPTDVAMQHVAVVAEEYAKDPEVLGASMWYLGQGFGGIANKCQALIAPMTTYTINTIFPDPVPPQPPPPPPIEGDNLLVNPSFEEGWTDIVTGYGNLVNQQPHGWDIRWKTPGESQWEINSKTGTYPTITAVPEMVHKLCRQLPPDECAGGQHALILDGTHTYKIFAAYAVWGARLKQTITGAPPGARIRVTIPVQVHYHDVLNEYDDTEVSIMVGNDNKRFYAIPDLPDHQWAYLSHEGIADANGRLELRIRIYNKWANRRSVFIDLAQARAILTEPPPGIPAPTPPVLAVDLSAHNTFDFEAADSQIQGFIFRSSNGISKNTSSTDANGVDKKFWHHLEKAKQHNVAFGVYHFYNERWGTEQVTHWMGILSDMLARGYRPSLGIWLDFEESSPTTEAAIRAGCEAAVTQNVTDQAVGIYTRASWWNNKVPASRTWPFPFRIWTAHWISNNPIHTPPPHNRTHIVPHHWNASNMWQFTSKGGQIAGQRSPNLDVNWILTYENTSKGQPGGDTDMSQYFFPPANQEFGDIFTLTNNWGQGPERVQLQRTGNISYLTKNQQYERRVVEGAVIRFDLDTSPGNGEYYTVESSTGWMPRYWRPGQTFTRQEVTRFFRKSDCHQVRSATWATPLTFDRLHPTWTSQAGITLQHVAELYWFVNGRVDERYWYAPGLGLVAWQKYDGKASWISELIPVGSQGNNVRESGCFA